MKEFVIYLNSGKCSWGKCIFCGWGKQNYPVKTLHELKSFFDEKMKEAVGANIDVLKIFNSGSFLDEKQVPRAFRSYVVRKCEDLGIKNLNIESRGEYVTDDFFEDMKSSKVKVNIGIGLEVADDEVLKLLNKGMTVKDYEEVAKKLTAHGFGVRSYILVNAPYSDEKTLDKTVKIALKYSDSMCLINWFPHGKSEAFDLWIAGKWKPFTENEFNKAVAKYNDKKIEKIFDEFIFIPRFPRDKEEWIKGATEKQLLHPHFVVWQDFINRFYKIPKEKEILLFVPCAFRKPYAFSTLHKGINFALKQVPTYDKIHEIVVSTPGVVPLDLSHNYPFTKYDWPEWEETPEIKKLYTEVTQQRIEDYLKAHGKSYKKFYCYLKPDSESYTAVHAACKKLKIKLTDCITKETYEKIHGEKNPLSLDDALKDLTQTLSK